MPLDTTKKAQVNIYVTKEQKLALQLQAHFEKKPIAAMLNVAVTQHLKTLGTDFRKEDPVKILKGLITRQLKRENFRKAMNALGHILNEEMDPEHYYESLDSLLKEAKGERMANPIHYQFPEDVRDLFPPQHYSPKEHRPMAVKMPPNEFVLVATGKENNKSETDRRSGGPNKRYIHITSLGEEGTTQTVGEYHALAEANGAPEARNNLRWELRDRFAILYDTDGNDVTNEFAAPGVRKMDDPEWEAQRAEAKAKRDAEKAEAKAKRDAEKAEKAAAKKSKSKSKSESPVGETPPAHEDNPEDVEDCVLHLVGMGMPEETARGIVTENGVTQTYAAYPLEQTVEGDV